MVNVITVQTYKFIQYCLFITNYHLKSLKCSSFTLGPSTRDSSGLGLTRLRPYASIRPLVRHLLCAYTSYNPVYAIVYTHTKLLTNFIIVANCSDYEITHWMRAFFSFLQVFGNRVPISIYRPAILKKIGPIVIILSLYHGGA